MGISHAELVEKGQQQLDLLVAYAEVEHEIGPHGHFRSETTSDRANPNYYGDGAVRFIANHHIDYADAAVELYRKENELPPGAVVYVEKKTY